MPDRPKRRPPRLSNLHHDLTPTEGGALALLGEGLSNEEICRELDLDYEALRSRLRRISERLGLSGRRLVAWAAVHRTCCIDPVIAP